MNDKSLTEILAMSGYAGYVWSAVGVTVIMLIILYWYNKQVLKNALTIQAQLKQERRQ